jgi:hypothetical protein
LLIAPYLLQSDCSERSAADAPNIPADMRLDALMLESHCTQQLRSWRDEVGVRRRPLGGVCTAQQMGNLQERLRMGFGEPDDPFNG